MPTQASPPPAASAQDVALVVQRLRPPTFSIAVALIIAVVLVEVSAVVYMFWLRSATANAQQVAKALENSPDKSITPPPNGFVTPAAAQAQAGQPATAPAPGSTDPASPTTPTPAPVPMRLDPTNPTVAAAPPAPVQTYEPPAPETSPLTPAMEPGQTPAAPPAAGSPDALAAATMEAPAATNLSDAATELRRKIHAINTEGLRLKELGDVDGAERNFHEALALDPKDSNTLLKLAALYTENNRKEDAKLYWQKLVDLGPTIGAPYLAAKEQLALLMPAAPKISIETSLQKKLFIDKVERIASNPTRPNNDFAMRIVVAANELEQIDPGLVRVQLFFYDKLPDGHIAPSAAQLKVKFEGGQQTWKKNSRETLGASFTLNSPEGREYYGYVLRINYDGKLQDEKIEPAALGELFAPATTPQPPAP